MELHPELRSAIDAGGDLAAAVHVFGHLDVFLNNFGLAEP